ncbi:MAG: hypothetical protein GWP32_09175 [Bacteroidetes bacterium]|nr:hypothetical protein [Bacteroidota bacterium]
MFINELHALLNEQQKYHKVLTEEFRHTLMGDDYRSGLLFFQRPAQYKRQGGGNMSCRYEAQKKPCSRAIRYKNGMIYICGLIP